MSEAKNSKFERTLALLLRPIARLMIANDLPLARVVELMKLALTTEAQIHKTETDSYISLKTGVHRKDVKRLRELDGSAQTGGQSTTPLAAVLTCWTQTISFQGADGLPRPLLRQSTDSSPGFDALVQMAKIDLPPATVLKELLKQDMVVVDVDGALSLMSDTYLPKLGDAVLDAFQATVVDHLNVAVGNALSEKTDIKAFDRVLRYSHLSQGSVEKLETASRAAALDYLNNLNTLAHSYQAADEAQETVNAGRFITGVFIAPQPPKSTT